MAKVSQINRNKKREKMVAQYATRRAALKKTTEDMSIPAEQRFEAHQALAKLPRNSSKTRIHHRCELTAAPRVTTANSSSPASSCAIWRISARSPA